MSLVSLQAIQEGVVKQIPVLLHGKNNPEILEALTRDAVQAYQDRAGFTGSFVITDENERTVPMPDDWLSVLSAVDSKSVYVSVSIFEKENEIGDMETVIGVSGDFQAVTPPFTIQYLKDLSGVEFDTACVPVSASGVIKKYLRVLIDIPNNRRLRSMMDGLSHPGVESIADESTLIARQEEIETLMDDSADVLMPTLIV